MHWGRGGIIKKKKGRARYRENHGESDGVKRKSTPATLFNCIQLRSARNGDEFRRLAGRERATSHLIAKAEALHLH